MMFTSRSESSGKILDLLCISLWSVLIPKIQLDLFGIFGNFWGRHLRFCWIEQVLAAQHAHSDGARGGFVAG